MKNEDGLIPEMQAQQLSRTIAGIGSQGSVLFKGYNLVTITEVENGYIITANHGKQFVSSNAMELLHKLKEIFVDENNVDRVRIYMVDEEV